MCTEPEFFVFVSGRAEFDIKSKKKLELGLTFLKIFFQVTLMILIVFILTELVQVNMNFIFNSIAVEP